MVSITYSPKEGFLNIKGHAGSGEPGHDLICAAVSALCHTLEANLQHLDGIGFLADYHAEIKPGKAKFVFKAAEGNQAVVRNTVNNIAVGFEILAQKAPENVRYTIYA